MNSRTVWCLQRFCKRIPERFGTCSISANAFPNGLTLAAFLQMNSRTVWCLQRFCEQKTFWFRARSLLARVWNGRGGACVPARTSAQRRFHIKICLYIMHYEHQLTMDAPLRGDTSGHTGTAPTKLHHAFCTIPLNDIIRPREIRP